MADSENDIATDSYLLEKQQERSKLQEELSEYLEYISERKDSEGKPLVSIPANFDVIANSMNRDDIRPGEKAPWCQYLFQESFDNILKQEFEGRYDQYLKETPDLRISKGLAQIQLFDRQLQDLNRKDPLSARPNVVDIEDKTFLTKKFEQEPGTSSGAVSPRSTKESARKHTAASAPAEIPVAPATATLSVEANRRYEQLMSEDDTMTQDEYLTSLKEMEEKLHEIDEDLSVFGHLERLADPEPEEDNKKEDVLTQQRKERANKEYMNKLDSMLDKITKPIDVSGLVYENPSIAGHSSKKSSSGASVVSKLDVPPPSAVKVDKLITMSDIVALLKVVHEQEDSLPSIPATTSSRRSTSRVASAGFATSNNDANSSSSSSGATVEALDTVEKLLKQYHSDIVRLSKIRAADHQIQLQQQQFGGEGDNATLVSGYSSSINTAALAGMNQRARQLLRAVDQRLARNEEIERGLLQEEDYFSSDDETNEAEDRKRMSGVGVVNGAMKGQLGSSSGGNMPSRMIPLQVQQKSADSGGTAMAAQSIGSSNNRSSSRRNHPAVTAEKEEQRDDEEEQEEEEGRRDLPPVPKPLIVVRPAHHSPKKRVVQQQQQQQQQATTVAVSPPPQPHGAMHVPIHKHIRIDHSGGHAEGQSLNSARHRGGGGTQGHIAPNVFTQAMHTSLSINGSSGGGGGHSSQSNSLQQQQQESAVASRHRVKNAMRAKKAHNIISSGSGGSTKLVI